MRIRCRLVRFGYLLGIVFSIAIANCSGSVRSNWAYPEGGRPRVLSCVQNKFTWLPMSVRYRNITLFALRSALASRVSSPSFKCAARIRFLPSFVLGPVLNPPCLEHFEVLLSLEAGRLHCSFV